MRGARKNLWRRRSSSSRPHGTVALEDRIDIDKIILNGEPHVVLRNMALRAEISAWRNGGQELAIAIGKMGDADHWGLRLADATSRVAREAFVGVRADFIPFCRMWNDGGLLRIISWLPD